ncbi:MAG TPA: hypothetical protein ENI20_18125 [Bacteroides sp.]|nr:hypothetical protein [Bacteroides sp.]
MNVKTTKQYLLCILLGSLMLPAAITATTWYVDAEKGSDNFDGSSVNSAWKSLEKVNSMVYQPGDEILFKSGCGWTGHLSPQGSGVKGRPIVIDKYGKGTLPVIDGAGMTGKGVISLYNQSFWEINNLELTNYAMEQGDRRGVEVKASDWGLVQHIYLKNLHIHHIMGIEGHGKREKRTAGIYIATVSDTVKPTRFDDILIEGCNIHHIYNQGIVTNNQTGMGDYPGTGSFHEKKFTNLRIRKNTVHHISKNAMIVRLCDSTCVVEYNVCYETALSLTALTGEPVDPSKRHGNTMFSRSCNGTVFQFNEGYLNRGEAYDGSMYDADLSSPNCIFQYSYSHDNAHGLFWICTTAPDSGVICRYNISQNDRGIIICPNYAFKSVYIYNNVIFVGEGLSPRIIDERREKDKTYYFYNNIIVNMSKDATYSWEKGTKRNFSSNLFFGIHPEGEPDDPKKITEDPLLVDPGSGGFGIHTVSGYKFKPGSPCIDAGFIFPDNGGLDYWGSSISDGKPDIGAFEYSEPEDR